MDSLRPFFTELSAAARQAADDALNRGLRAEDKGGGSYDPVTEADRLVEQALRRYIETRFPADGIVGEEFGATRADAPRIWSLDPIDGTRALVCGLPSWTVLVGLVVDGQPIAGMIDAPAVDELIFGDGSGTVMIDAIGSRPVRTSGVADLAEVRLSTTDPYLFDGDAAPRFERLRQAARLTRFGLDGYAYARLAAGTLDLVAETGLKPHDWQALVPVVRGAGGVIGNWRGGEDMSGGDVLAAASDALFAQALELLA